jgi:hypothetical protein
MIGGIRIPQNPQAAMTRRPKPEDAASHITVRSCVCLFAHRSYNLIRINNDVCWMVCSELVHGPTWLGKVHCTIVQKKVVKIVL